MDIDNASLGLRMRNIRVKRHLTLDELGQKVGFTADYIGQIERGVRQGSMELLVKISNALMVSIEDILVDSLLVTNAGKKSQHEDDFSYLLLDCSDREAKFIIKVAEFLKTLLKKYFQK